jgi:hypothetical protein
VLRNPFDEEAPIVKARLAQTPFHRTPDYTQELDEGC